MVEFQYEWWNVEAEEPTGVYVLEVKAKNRENAIKQFKKMTNGNIRWETMKLDRKGYNRRF